MLSSDSGTLDPTSPTNGAARRACPRLPELLRRLSSAAVSIVSLALRIWWSAVGIEVLEQRDNA
jgi:hypothetical protein